MSKAKKGISSPKKDVKKAPPKASKRLKTILKKDPVTTNVMSKSARTAFTRVLPLVTTLYRAFCIDDDFYVSDHWVSLAQAVVDAEEHIKAKHTIRYDPKIIG